MNFNDNFNINNNNINNINTNTKEAGTNYNNNIIEQNIDINNIYNIMNINNLNNQNISQYEEEEEEEEEEDESTNNNNLIPTENFSQQVNFLPQYKNDKWKTVSTKQKIKPKINQKKTKLNFKSKNTKNKYNKFRTKIEKRPEFNLCTKIDQPKKGSNLSLFYGTKGDSKYEKQIKLRQKKIEEYEEDLLRKKEIYKAKRQRENFELKKNYNEQRLKAKTSYNFYNNKNNYNNDDFSQQIKNITKIKCPDTNLKNYECNPQKYDIIIHSLLSEISQIKLQREKENKEFEEQLKKLQNNSYKKRPKSGIKNLKSGTKLKKDNNTFKNLKKYFDKNNKKNNKRPATANKIKNIKKIENEIPVNNIHNNKNNYFKNNKDKILEKIKNLEMQKYNKLNEIIELKNNNNNTINKSSNINNINNINYISPNIPQIQNISNSQNIILNPTNINVTPIINHHLLNYQDKTQILHELNNNIAKFSSGIPKLMNKVNEALNKIYSNTENPIKKAINNHPFVIMASKVAHQSIKKNIGTIVEDIIDDLVLELKNELDDIDEQKRKFYLMNNFEDAKNKLNEIKMNEIMIMKKHFN